MDALSPSFAALLADAVLALHAGIVAFVVFGQFAILIGAWRRWRWIRNFTFRASHLALLAFIALQAWLGQLCPLTVWEQALRARAGQAAYAGSFVEHWLSRLIFFDAPWWTFVAAYTAFAALAIASWKWVPPLRSQGGA
ncbi:MAG TPA: DUF2784 domain-containing protein [Luteimonas sp.]|nr:DUF2784 domain-containing protein [Luteimonas sp.]